VLRHCLLHAPIKLVGRHIIDVRLWNLLDGFSVLLERVYDDGRR